MSKQLSVWAKDALIILGIGFSAYLNAANFLSILGTDLTGWIMSMVGLALFDFGLLGWSYYFTSGARGTAQRAVAAIATVLCLGLTLAGASSHILLTQSMIERPDWAGLVAVGGIIVGLATNIIAAIAVHMTDPEVRRQMQVASFEGEVMDMSYNQLREKGGQIAASVADRVSNEMRDDAVRRILAASYGGANSTPVLQAPTQTKPSEGWSVAGQEPYVLDPEREGPDESPEEAEERRRIEAAFGRANGTVKAGGVRPL